jgi:hypothetical protein
LRRSLAGYYKNARAYDRTYAKGYEIERSQCTPKTVLASLLRLAHQLFQRFSGQ